MIQLCYSALSPYSRKVRMAMDYMELDYEVTDSCDVAKYPVWSPRAEIPVLADGANTVRESSVMVEYLARRFPDAPSLLPSDPAAYAAVKEWEIVADTMLDPVVTNIAIFLWAKLGPMPEGMLEAAREGIDPIYDRMEQALEDKDFVAGDLSIADIALYPHIHGAQHCGLAFDKSKYPNVRAWVKRIRGHAIGEADFAEVLKWWSAKDTQDVDFDKINWGTHRLEHLLAHGFHDWFTQEIERDGVLWSVGPKNNALNSPLSA